jgi:hypothetical protein
VEDDALRHERTEGVVVVGVRERRRRRGRPRRPGRLIEHFDRLLEQMEGTLTFDRQGSEWR